MFLKEPIFTGDFLGEVIGEEHFFQDLGKSECIGTFEVFVKVSTANVK